MDNEINETEKTALIMVRETIEGTGEYKDKDLDERILTLRRMKAGWTTRNEFLKWQGAALRAATDGIEYLTETGESRLRPHLIAAIESVASKRSNARHAWKYEQIVRVLNYYYKQSGKDRTHKAVTEKLGINVPASTFSEWKTEVSEKEQKLVRKQK